MRPVMRGMCQFKELKDGSLDLCDIALMNEAIDVEEENKLRYQDVLRLNNGS